MQVSAYAPRASNADSVDPPTGTASVAVTTSIQQITLPGAPYGGETIGRFVNSGTQTIFWCYGTSASLSVSNGMPMMANTAELFTLPKSITKISVIGPATGSTLYITAGDGV